MSGLRVIYNWSRGYEDRSRVIKTDGKELWYKGECFGYTRDDGSKWIKHSIRKVSRKYVKDALLYADLDNEIGSVINSLGKVTKLLQSYCHDPNCSHTHQCPQMHQQCKDKLDLNSAIAWTIADYFYFVKSMCYKKKVKEIENVVIAVETLIIVVGKFQKYDELLWLLRDFRTFLRRLIEEMRGGEERRW